MKLARRTSIPLALLLGFCIALSGCDNNKDTRSSAKSASATTSQEKRPLSHNELTTLLENKKLNTTGDFKEFLSSVIASKAVSSSRGDALMAYVDNGTINESAAALIPSLLGLWVRLHYYDDAEALLAKMVAIPSANTLGVPSNQNPDIIAMGKLIEQMAWKWKLIYKNIDNYVFEVSLPGDTVEDVGIITHADIVPADPKKWLLDDGQQLNPYKLTKVGDRLYGRGSEDDKSSIVSAMYAMKAIKENKLPLHRGIRLMVRTMEETAGKEIDYYKKHRILPPYNIVLDSLHPVVIPENNTGSIKALFPVSALPDAKKPAITQFTSSLPNQTSAESTAVILSGNPTDVAKQLNTAKPGFLSDTGSDVTITVSPEQNQVRVVVTSTSTHSSQPEQRVNTVTAMAGFLAASHLTFVDNE
uniref:M20/M25/M40 family metallo-hydrolase n=1 Tax=Candidatus Sororendozoicomonas aggregata TaxID=3073239 RepID=UPI002ED1CE2B